MINVVYVNVQKSVMEKGKGCGNGQCKRVTIAVFASGKIIITGGRSIEQLVDSYNFIKGVLDDVEKFKMIEEINK